ncbi:MAG: hypothetical protein KHZ38_10045, partial [Haemophilus parainfluenzae]|nr:hypothetical protein [Haemophilus parainfluenzae]
MNIEQRQFTLMIKSSDKKKIEFFCKKALAKNSEMPIIRPTQRRAVVTLKKNQCVVLFCSLTIYQTICVGTC